MTVQDYAEEMNFSVQAVLDKCAELGIKVSSKDDFLDDDAIILLDNTMDNYSNTEDMSYELEDAMDDLVDDIMQDTNIQIMEKSNKTNIQKVKKHLVPD